MEQTDNLIFANASPFPRTMKSGGRSIGKSKLSTSAQIVEPMLRPYIWKKKIETIQTIKINGTKLQFLQQ
ncbi:hypothetical protein H6G54_09540 [Anabaena cylindrica FACHB-243]|uniref:Uncharacterized protein n=1 Tax=Anabaena cylindrica (strain ATCC 27899 / PCC 7122) TaxID=272123 RepID=K9ZLC7_ANACC|nr:MULTISPECIES: hypothetical protein [Anabaena]AFZ59996.1 hypothetical protein Anacy_4645 [Anabaena cylindrica PCC 7122]MBD2417946.1 hypothetical protein [Anabaena cylindrica FACHB-243]MBY5282473.1 hypothetical protein [Anabaena sp. CCAP 1446/1C]MBY5309900.1 hypothetical protein [Anabaena sp. CCAP 1446/1C]MCM2404862.1 hypothetical protein [Anabaena sp. CCAP 1446/1C]